MSKPANFYVERYTAAHFEQWNAFVSKAKNATFLFNRNFMDYHSDRFKDHSLLVFRDDKLYALLPANEVDGKVISHQGLTYGSFILNENAELLKSFEAFKKLLEFLYSEGIKTLEIRNIPSFYNTIPADELAYFIFKANGKLIKRDVLMVIDTTNKLEPKKGRKKSILKAVKNGLTIKVENNFDFFWNELLIPNLKEKYDVSPVHSLEEIKLLANRFPDNIKHINVYQEDKIVAGTTVFLTQTTIHPQYISHNNDNKAYGSLDLAYDFLINHFDKSKRYFDFNTSSEKNGTELNGGIIFWKESYGGRAYTSDCYELETANYKTIDLNII